MKLRSVVWAILVVVALSGMAIVGLANPMGGPDDQPYFSDATGAPKTCFVLNEPVYVAYFDTKNDYNNSVNAVDTMYVSVDSQGTENFAAGNWAADVVSGKITDGPDIGTIPGDDPTDIHTKAGNGPNAQVLALQEQGLDNGLFIGDVGASTPVVILGGDLVTVGLTADNQDVAYVQAQLLGWWDSVTNPDPGNAGSYGAGDDIVVKLTAEAANTWANASGNLYYRINGGVWQNGGVWTDVTGALGGAYPDRYLEITAPGTAIGDTVEVLWQPGTAPPGGCSTTPMLSTTIVDQPVDLADATFPGGGAPTNASTGFQRDYMTIHEAVANVGGNNWWIGVHAAPAVPAYDSTLDTFPVAITAAEAGLTIIGDGTVPPVVVVSGAAAPTVGFDIQAGANNVTLDYLDIRSDAATASFLIQLTNGPTDTTIQNCLFNMVGNASMGISVGAAGSTRLTITDNTWTAVDAGDGAIWLNGPNPNVTVTNNTFNGAGGGYAIEGMGWTNGLIDNNTINNFNFGVFLGAEITGTSAVTDPVTITRNTITNCADGIRFYTGAGAGAVRNATVEGNRLTGNTDGIHVSDGNSVIDTATFVVRYNHIVGNTTGINDTDADAPLNAELNWWGSTTGPAHAKNANGIGDASTDNVDYRPWLNGEPENGVGATLANNADPAVQGNKTVQGSSWYWTINQALAAANAAGCGGGGAPCLSVTIDVSPGTYAEEIDLSAYGNIASLELRSTSGAGSTNIEAGQDANIIKVGANQHLKVGDFGAAGLGFSIYFDSAAVPAPTADKILHLGSDLQIYDCTIDGTTGTGIHVNSGAAGGSIARNTITGCDTAGIWLETVQNGMTVDGNTIESCGDGITIDSGANTLTNNVIRYNAHHGIDLNSNGNQVGGSGNNIYNNTENGLRVNSDNNTIEGNEIHANGMFGVLIEVGATGNSFDANKIYSNANPGVQLNAATGNVFNTDNSVANTNCIWDNDFNGDYGALPYGQMENTTTTDVDATHNYWGSPDGPFNAMRNPSGDMHSRVSDFILIDPWAITCSGGLADATITLSCGSGWYLTSVPLVPSDPTAEDVYSGLPVFAAYQYDPTTGGYVDLTGQPIAWSDGYWLWLMGDETITVEGTSVTTDQIFAFGDAGWQQFSVPAVDIPVTGPDEGGRDDPDILFRAPGGPWYTYNEAIANGLILPGIFRYDTCAGAYDPAMGADAVLDPWTGYWIETLVDGVEVQVPVAYWIANPWVAPTSFHPMRVNTNGRVPPAPPALPVNYMSAIDEATGLVVYNEPNPIRDVHTTTFHVMAAQPIESILVQIFDQSGALVFEKVEPGDELVWHTDNDYGEFLANGVYFYRVSALIDGEWVLAGVRKLVIFR